MKQQSERGLQTTAGTYIKQNTETKSGTDQTNYGQSLIRHWVTQRMLFSNSPDNEEHNMHSQDVSHDIQGEPIYSMTKVLLD